eukprot:m.463790 g.463790  ORF g.463790 m.463790 type:complete len:55 (-) comp23169_c0_seq1:919-1083(-)
MTVDRWRFPTQQMPHYLFGSAGSCSLLKTTVSTPREDNSNISVEEEGSVAVNWA